jgi:hypothetical protein
MTATLCYPFKDDLSESPQHHLQNQYVQVMTDDKIVVFVHDQRIYDTTVTPKIRQFTSSHEEGNTTSGAQPRSRCPRVLRNQCMYGVHP